MEEKINSKTIRSNSEDIPKQMKHSNTMNYNLSQKYNSLFQKSKNNINNEIIKENTKHLFFARKINIKDDKNIFYKKGIKEIFNNKNIYFSNRYYNHTIKIGNSEKKFLTHEPKLNTDKKMLFKRKPYNLLIRKLSLSPNQNKSLLSNLILKNKTIDDLDSKLNKLDYKRPSVFLANKEYITDGELKILFEKLKENEKSINNKSRNNRNFFRNNINIYPNKSEINEINNRLYLQEKILNEFKNNKKKNDYIIEKIKHITKKKNEDLLINKIENYRYNLQKINKSQRIKNNENYYKTIKWLSSLRKYDNNDNNNNIIIKNDNEKNKEDILENYINKYQYSFGNSSNLYSDLESSISPLYALILPQNLKCKEIIKNTHIYKSDSLPNIVGKNLLDYEIELSKSLEGKKKILVKNNSKDEEIKPLILAKSNRLKNYQIPKAITNTINLHFNK